MLAPAKALLAQQGFAGASKGSADGDLSIAKFNIPAALAIDTKGTIYLADQQNYRIRKISKIDPCPGALVCGNAGICQKP